MAGAFERPCWFTIGPAAAVKHHDRRAALAGPPRRRRKDQRLQGNTARRCKHLCGRANHRSRLLPAHDTLTPDQRYNSCDDGQMPHLFILAQLRRRFAGVALSVPVWSSHGEGAGAGGARKRKPAGYAREVRRAFSSFTSTVYSGSTSWTMGAREFCATN